MELIQANHEMENQLQEEEVKRLKELTAILEEKASSRFYETKSSKLN